MVVFDPFEGLEPGPDGQFVGNDAGGQPIVVRNKKYITISF